MEFEFKLTGLDKLIMEVEKVASGEEIDKLTREILREESEVAKNKIKGVFPTSKYKYESQKSGKKGYRPDGHFLDNIPSSKIKKKGDFIITTIGSPDKGKYFYTKFPEWGTSKQKPLLIFEKVREEMSREMEVKLTEEYTKLLNDKLGG